LNQLGKGILVTGSHRSGSTWVGNMISLSEQIRYVDEPFNLKYKNSPFKFWFEYVSENNEDKYLPYLINEFSLSPYLYWDILNIQKKQDIKPRLRKIYYQLIQKKSLIKDPIAILSAEWIYKRFAPRVIVLIRHPAAFVSSVRMLAWKHDFSQFLKQKELMDKYFQPFRDEIQYFATQEKDLLDQAILLWKLFHHVILIYQQKYPEWFYYRYEDLAAKPIPLFEEIYTKLDLDFSKDIESKIFQFTSTSNKESATTILDPHTVERNSKATLEVWKSRLSVNEIKKIREEVEPISKHFYSDIDWQ